MSKTLYRLYIDDSGCVERRTTNTPETRFGSITGVIFQDSYLQEKFNSGLETLSIKHFGTDADGRAHNLHRRLLASPAKEGPFASLRDATKREAWNADSLSMFERAEYTVISASLDKVAWYFRYPDWDGDFYDVLVQAVLERCFYFLNKRNAVAEVNIETKGHRDQRINARYRHALEHGYEYIKAAQLQSVFTSKEMNVLKKEDRIPGCQLADLLAGPCMNHVRFLHTRRYPIESPYVQALCKILDDKKFYREIEGTKVSGPNGFGRIWRPK